MDIKQLSSMGAFIPKGLVKKEVEIKRPAPIPESEWDDPSVPEFDEENLLSESMTIHVKRRSSADFLQMVNAKDNEKALVAVLLSVVDESGNQVFEDLDQVSQLKEWLLIPLMLAVGEVNSPGKKKNSRTRKNFGVSSPSPSEDGASPNGKKPSAKKNAQHGSPTATNEAR